MAQFVRNPLEVVPQQAYEEDFVRFGGIRSPRAWVTSPAGVKAVLLDERDKFRKLTQIRLLRPLLGSGILTSEGAEWKWQRQAASPMFRPSELAAFVPAFVRAAQARLKAWRAKPAGSVHAIDAEMTHATFDVIAATLLPSSDRELGLAIQGSVSALQKSGGWDLLFAAMNLPQWLPRPGMISEVRAMKTLRSTVAAYIREQRERTLMPGMTEDLTQRLIAARDPESGQQMDEERLVDNVLTFFLAGHETTAKALAWTLYLVARYPEWAARLEEEIGRVVGNGALGAQHIEQLVLTQQVLKESMRLYPPVPIMSRQAVADVEIEGHAVKAGTSLLIPIYALHRHARRWEDADAFRPERFAPENEAAIPRYQYMPFGAGPRVCVGRAFATMEAVALLATFVQHARFELSGGAEPIPLARVTLLARGGMPLRVTAR
jgi:cytochrome P450